MENKMILLVEDTADDEALALRAFEKNNIEHSVVVVRDGAEALDFLFGRGDYADRDPRDTPQLIILDLRLPKMDGIELVRRIRADPKTRMIPVVIFTSSPEEEDILRSYDIGVNSFMRKPADFDQFVDTVRQLSLYWLGLNEPPPSKEGPSNEPPSPQ